MGPRFAVALPMLLLVLALMVGSTTAALLLTSSTIIQSFYYLKWVAVFPAGFILSFALILLLESTRRAQQFIDKDTNHLNLKALWGALGYRAEPVFGALITTLMGVGIVSSAHFNEIYRLKTHQWFDSYLWALEKPFFEHLQTLGMSTHYIWDFLYFLVWPYFFVCMAVLYRLGNRRHFALMGIAVITAFYLTRAINFALPTAGPAFFAPEFFEHSSSRSFEVQSLLRLYMAGKLEQNGLIPGTMALPSLHVSLMFLSVVFLQQKTHYSLVFTVPAMFLVWVATVALGWHYILDGITGIAVGAAAIAIAHKLQQLLEPVQIDQKH